MSNNQKPKRRRMNWAAGFTAFAALLSGIAAMATAATGLWRPPVPIPVPKVSITWVAATPPAAQVDAVAAAPTPRESPPKAAPSSYQADWSAGMNGWVGAAQWKTIPGKLVSDGSSRRFPGSAAEGADSVQPAYQPSTPGYAAEARIQIIDPGQSGCYVDVQLHTQAEGQGQSRHGYALGYTQQYGQQTGAFVGRFFPYSNFTILKQTTFSPSSDWHVYRAEVEQNQLTLKIDGSTVLQTTDNTYLDAGQIGLGSGNCQVQVSSFTVTPL